RRMQTQVIPHEIRRRLHMPAVQHQPAVERDWQLQLTTTLPYDVVVVRAVEPAGVEPVCRSRPRERDRAIERRDDRPHHTVGKPCDTDTERVAAIEYAASSVG